jgi:hypothetical protein
MNTQLAETLTQILDDLEAMLKEIAEFSPGQSLEDVQAEYEGKLVDYMTDYLQSSRSVVVDRNLFRRAVNDGFTFAFIAGWADAGASTPITDEAQAWLNGRIDQEVAFANQLFIDLKALRDDTEMSMEDKLARAASHAAGYTQSTNGIYAQGGLMAAPEVDLTFDGEDGSSDSVCQKTGGTCVKLRGKTHPASWWLKNDLIPYPGNTNYDCGGWNCRHFLRDKDGNIWASASGEW